ncbi:hypothetical protein [Arthrobacter sp. H5]|uniref:hypothetical protein n=1 Tax=Arthrobacter sp. H5 TaxID=1267973 RepID=UPI00047FDB1A|nr:hypothetical protein [Arthrobacter sp. H5]
MKPYLSVAVFCAAAFTLSACAAAEPEEALSTISLPSEMPLAEPSPTAPAEQAPGADLKAGGSVTNTGIATTAGIKECVVVAAGVSSIVLAPLSFMSGEDGDTMNKLEEQIERLEGKAPPELEEHFKDLEEAAESGPDGSGEFDEVAFRAALEPIEQWLRAHCTQPSR